MKQYFEDSVELGRYEHDTAPIRKEQLPGLPIGSAVLTRDTHGDHYLIITIKTQKPILIPAPHAAGLLDKLYTPDRPVLVMNEILQRKFRLFHSVTINSGIVKLHV